VVGSSRKISGGRVIRLRREVEAPPHPAGELRDRLVRGLFQVELSEQPLGGGARVGRAEPLQPAEHPQVLRRRQVLVNRRELAGHPDQLADAVRFTGNVNAEHPGLAGVDRQQRGEHPQGGRLPCPVRAEHAEDLALAYLKVDAVDRAKPTKLLDQAGCVNSGSSCHLIVLPRSKADTMRRYAVAATPRLHRGITD